MQFVLTGRDGKDAGAQERRKQMRDAHLAQVDKLVAAGHALMGVALLDEDGQMCGSLMVLDFPDRAALDAWLENEPYVTGRVWETIEITEGKVAPAFQKKRAS